MLEPYLLDKKYIGSRGERQPRLLTGTLCHTLVISATMLYEFLLHLTNKWLAPLLHVNTRVVNVTFSG